MIEKKNSMIGLYICSPLRFGLVNVSKGKQTKCLGMKLYNIYIYTFCPLFWGLDPQKQGLSQSKASFGFQVCIVSMMILL